MSLDWECWRDVLATKTTLKDQVEALEAKLVREALWKHRWNRSAAAEELGLSRVGLSNKIRRYGLDRKA